MRRDVKIALLQSHYKSLGLDLSLSHVDLLQKTAHTIQKITRQHCDGDLDALEFNRRIRKLKVKLTSFLDDDFEIHFDPQGYCLKVHSFHPEFFN